MATLDKHLKNVLKFMKNYQNLIDCHCIDFITDNLWNKCLPDSMRTDLERTNSQKHLEKSMIDSEELCRFMEEADSLLLNNSRFIVKLGQTITEIEDSTTEINSKNSVNLMKNKKEYEIKKLSQLIGSLVPMDKKNLVIDVGAGKGYLSTSISERYGVTVLAVDSSKSHHDSAIRRQERIHKKKRQKETLIEYSVQHIDEKTDYTLLIQSHYPYWDIKEGNCILTGLHTCGKLADSMIQSFINARCIDTLCIVPCCYHLAGVTLTGKFQLTKNARMLAQQSVERTVLRTETGLQHPTSLFYRAILQIILRSLGIAEIRIGRGAPTKDFSSYVYWALTKIGVDTEKIPSPEYLAQLYESHANLQWKFNIFQSIRVYLGSVVETAIVLDRILYLETSARCSKVALIRLFDPLVSPRCYAIVAFKSNTKTPSFIL